MSDSISTALLNQHTPSTPPIVQATTLASFTEQRLQDYFLQLDGNKPSQLYEMVIQQVEQPLIKVVLQQTHNNQSEAAKILGISRGTLRKKMALFGMLWTWYHGLVFAFVRFRFCSHFSLSIFYFGFSLGFLSCRHLAVILFTPIKGN